MLNYTRVFSSVYRKTQTYYSHALKPLGISAGQFMFILCICENPGLTQESLAKELQFDKGSVANAVQQLLKHGFITRQTNKKDRRAYNLYPTEKAQETYPKIVELQEKWHQVLAKNMTDIERDIFDRLLEKVPYMRDREES